MKRKYGVNHVLFLQNLSIWDRLSYLFVRILFNSGSLWVDIRRSIWLYTSNSAPKWRFPPDMLMFKPTKMLFLDSQILSGWYHFNQQLTGNNIYKKIKILSTEFFGIFCYIQKCKFLHSHLSPNTSCHAKSLP